MNNIVENAYVVLLGMGTVFLGLVCIVFLCMAMSKIVQGLEKTEEKTIQAPTPSTPSSAAPIADRQAIIAASCAVIAEELGENVKNIKVVSFKRI